jgi:translocation and assembly module TamA
VRLGLGASAEQTRWELPRIKAEYINRSLFGGLRRLELSSTVGYAFVPNPYPGQYDPARSGITNLTSAQLTIPSIFLPGFDWISRIEFAREIQSGFSYNDVAARTGLLYRRGSHSVSGSLNFVRYFQGNVQGTGDLATSPNPGVLQCIPSCTLTYPEIRYGFDGRDNVIEPTQGVFISIGLQQTLKPGSFSYFRINPDVRGYAPMTRYAVLAMRAEYGGLFTETAGGDPFTQRFFLGGQNDQRGYGPLRQGPKLGFNPCNPNNADQRARGCTAPFATSSVPLGGTSAVLFSGEVRFRADFLLNHLGIVPFVDASTVGNSPKRPFANGLEVAVGLGLRYLTGFGPIRLDVGYLINPKDVTTQSAAANVAPTRVSAFCPPGFGCISESRWAYHVTLGEAF